MVVVRKNISREKGELRLFDEIRYFFYITNEWTLTAADIVLAPLGANGRCNQENKIQQTQGGVHALQAPVDTLVSNWAYMVMTSLAWNMKAWAALLLPETGRWADQYRADKAWLLGIEFKTFINDWLLKIQADGTWGKVWDATLGASVESSTPDAPKIGSVPGS